VVNLAINNAIAQKSSLIGASQALQETGKARETREADGVSEFDSSYELSMERGSSTRADQPIARTPASPRQHDTAQLMRRHVSLEEAPGRAPGRTSANTAGKSATEPLPYTYNRAEQATLAQISTRYSSAQKSSAGDVARGELTLSPQQVQQKRYLDNMQKMVEIEYRQYDKSYSLYKRAFLRGLIKELGDQASSLVTKSRRDDLDRSEPEVDEKTEGKVHNGADNIIRITPINRQNQQHDNQEALVA